MKFEKDIFTTLKKGDIAYTNLPGINSPFFDVTIESVTPSGRVTLKDGRKFRPDGSSMAASSTRLYLKTPERVQWMKERHDRMAVKREISQVEWNNLSTEKLLEIMKIVNRKNVTE